jgi:hypothetical protein
VREREENTIDTIHFFWFFDEIELSQSVEVPVNVTDGFAGLLIRRYEHELDLRMKQQDTQQLRAAITGAAKDPDLDFVLVFHY